MRLRLHVMRMCETVSLIVCVCVCVCVCVWGVCVCVCVFVCVCLCVYPHLVFSMACLITRQSLQAHTILKYLCCVCGEDSLVCWSE